jgi:hypothetical protein
VPSFERVDDHRFRATEAVGGAWGLGEQHVAPALGLLVHAVELDRDRRRGADLQVARLSYDILGTMPVDTVELAVRVARPGRTIELVERTLRHGDRDAVRLRAWLLQPHETRERSGTALPRVAPPDELPRWDPTTVWEGGFIASVEVRREQEQPGRARYWVRTRVPLLDSEPVGDLARFLGLLDIANGMTVRAEPSQVAFPNVDLTAHLFRTPRGEWAGFDTTVSFGASGIGLTSSVVHDLDGPVGTVAQSLTLRPRD